MFRRFNTSLEKILPTNYIVRALTTLGRWVTDKMLLARSSGKQSYATFSAHCNNGITTAKRNLQSCQERLIKIQLQVDQKAAQIKEWIIHHHSMASDDIRHIFNVIKAYCLYKWAKYQPHIDKFSKWSIAVTTTASTLQTSIQILPIILTISTILASGIPLIGFLFPEFFFTEMVLFTFILSVSIFAGYLKYHELVTRAELDATTEQHIQVIAILEKRIGALEKAYKEYAPMPSSDPLPFNKGLRLSTSPELTAARNDSATHEPPLGTIPRLRATT